MAFRFKRGDYVEDLITDFKGVITARMDSITGCNRYCIQPTGLDNTGKMIDALWIDEHSLRLDTTKTRLNLERIHEGDPPG